MATKKFYLALQGQNKGDDVDNTLEKLAERLEGEGTIVYENLPDIEHYVMAHRYFFISDQIERAKKFPRYETWGYFCVMELKWDENYEKELESSLRQEYGSLPVYEVVIRQVGYVDDGEEMRFHKV